MKCTVKLCANLLSPIDQINQDLKLDNPSFILSCLYTYLILRESCLVPIHMLCFVCDVIAEFYVL